MEEEFKSLFINPDTHKTRIQMDAENACDILTSAIDCEGLLRESIDGIACISSSGT